MSFGFQPNISLPIEHLCSNLLRLYTNCACQSGLAHWSFSRKWCRQNRILSVFSI